MKLNLLIAIEFDENEYPPAKFIPQAIRDVTEALSYEFIEPTTVTQLQWQPINTAPIGEACLIFDGYDITSASCDHQDHKWYLLQAGPHAETSEVDTPPTHWMPLPPTPNPS